MRPTDRALSAHLRAFVNDGFGVVSNAACMRPKLNGRKWGAGIRAAFLQCRAQS